MFDFFNEFYKSELAKNNIAIIVVSIILLLMAGACIMWLYMSKIYLKSVQNDNADLKKQNSELKGNVETLNNRIITLQAELAEVKQDRDDLLKTSDQLCFYYQMKKMEKMKKEDSIDPALDQFIRK